MVERVTNRSRKIVRRGRNKSFRPLDFSGSFRFGIVTFVFINRTLSSLMIYRDLVAGWHLDNR